MATLPDSPVLSLVCFGALLALLSRENKHPEAHGRRLDIVEEVLAGKEKIVSHEGASQYRSGGISSCALAALHFVRLVLARVEEGLEDGQLLKAVVSESTINEVISICTKWPSNTHLELEDIYKTPLFESAMTLAFSSYDEIGFDKFREMLEILESATDTCAAVLITRPPEIITCFKLTIKGHTLFMIFDSHPRPDYPHGPGVILSTSLDTTAARLDKLLAVDNGLLTDVRLDRQTTLLSHFSGHYFEPKSRSRPVNNTIELAQTTMESSLAVLSLQAEVEDLKRQRQSMQTELGDLNDRYDAVIRMLAACSCSPEFPQSPSTTESPISGPSKHSSSSPSMNALEYDGSCDRNMHPGSSQGSRDHLIARQSQTGMEIEQEMQCDPQTSSLPGALPSEHRHSGSIGEPSSNWLSLWPILNVLDYFRRSSNKIPRPAEDHLSTEEPEIQHSALAWVDKTPAENHMNDCMIAARLQIDWQQENALQAQAKQREFEEENTRLIAERAALQEQAQSTFECGVCLDKHAEDYIARISDCDHDFCRDCLKTYVISKLEDKMYPIFCPTCFADDCANPAMVTDELARILGLNDHQNQILQELQIAPLSILLECQKCKQSAFVDREEYETSSTLDCPFPACDHVWCKACGQTIEPESPDDLVHSCDGITEFENLMKRRGWRHCPECKTAFQKDSGCNHMTCSAPGCHTHFCYACGGFITNAVGRREIESALSAHYAGCNMFEDVVEVV